LGVASRAKISQVLCAIVEFVAVDVIERQRQRRAEPDEGLKMELAFWIVASVGNLIL